MGGLATAKVLSKHFDDVVVIEKDTIQPSWAEKAAAETAQVGVVRNSSWGDSGPPTTFCCTTPRFELQHSDGVIGVLNDTPAQNRTREGTLVVCIHSSPGIPRLFWFAPLLPCLSPDKGSTERRHPGEPMPKTMYAMEPKATIAVLPKQPLH